MRHRALSIGSMLFALAACSSAPEPAPVVAPPPAPTVEVPPPPARESPPPSGPERAFEIPKPVWGELPNGLRFATIVSKSLPVVQIRVAVLAGKSADGDKPGLVSITGDMLKDGGAGRMSSKDLVNKIEALGSGLSITTGFDRTVLSMAVTNDRLGEATALLGVVLGSPAFAPTELDKLKKREMDRTADAARGSGSWAASMVLYKELLAVPSGHHPYASYDTTPADVARISLTDVKAAHKKYFGPKNTFVVVVGDTTPDDVKTAVTSAFGSLKGEAPPALSFPEPTPAPARKIFLVDRPRASQSDVYVGALGLGRQDKTWTTLAMTNQILGGGASGRLFVEVREKQSLAYGASSSLHELAHAPALFVANAGTQTAKTGLALAGILAELDKLATAAPSDAEVEMARRYMTDTLAIRLETIGAMADELVRLKSLGLADDYDDVYRRELKDVTAPLVGQMASGRIRKGHEIIVVAGDSQVVGAMLSHFGEVTVVDPAHNFDRVRTIPMDEKAPLETAGEKGK